MHKWEYLLLEIVAHRARDGSRRIRELDIVMFQDWEQEGPILDEYLNELGEQGWELVQYDTTNHDYIFKRPKS